MHELRPWQSFWRNSLIGMLLLLSFGMGQTAPDNIIQVELLASQDGVLPGQKLGIALQIDIEAPWHVYAPEGNDEFVIPVEAFMELENQPFSLGAWSFPEPERIAVAGVPEPAAVYGGRLVLRNEIQVSETLDQNLVLKGELGYQACDDAQCLIPGYIPFSIEIPLSSNGTEINLLHAEIFSVTPPTASASEALVGEQEDDDISGLVAEHGLILTFIIIFFGGLALNLTPCVYPLIPITISFFGGNETSRGRTFWMALAYVLGIAVTYSILGVVAALGGGLFGTLLTNPIVLIAIAAILVGLSLSMFGVYEFRLPTGLMTAASQSKAGIFGSFFMGLTLGIVAAPCVGPFVIGLLTYVAAQQSVVLGFAMFFTLAMGLGLPYLFLAMFSSKLSSMPRSGTWMVGVRVIFGLVLIAMAIYFLMPLLGAWANLVMAVFLIGSGVYLIMFDHSGDNNAGFNYIKQTIAILLIIIGTWMGIPEPEAHSAGIEWMHPESMEQLEQLLETDKPVMIDVFADWCIPCKEMDKFTFPDPGVVDLSKNFIAIKIDLTQQNGAFEKEVQQAYAIKGVPSYIFIRNGIELAALRSSGFENAEAFMSRMKKAL